MSRDFERPAGAAIALLRGHLASHGLPGWSAQKLACPPGRPKEGMTEDRAARRAGVVALLCPNAEGHWSLVFMRRTQDGSPHSGQLSFPGGAEEPVDSGDLIRTAFRECEEEVGVALNESHLVGAMTPLYIPPSSFWVQPVLAVADELPQFVKEPTEVADILVTPLSELPAAGEVWPTTRFEGRRGTFVSPGWDVGGTVLWGATAMMTAEVLSLCAEAGFPPSFAT